MVTVRTGYVRVSFSSWKDAIAFIECYSPFWF